MDQAATQLAASPAHSSKSQSLYRQVLGPDFEQLHEILRTFHGTVPAAAGGTLGVERSPARTGRWLAAILRLPQATAGIPVTLQVSAIPGGERWVRSFGVRGLITTQRPWRGLLLESAGPITFGFRLVVEDGGMRFDHRRTWFCGIPVPRLVGPAVAAWTMPGGDGWQIDVQLRAPLVGLIMRYHGMMKPT